MSPPPIPEGARLSGGKFFTAGPGRPMTTQVKASTDSMTLVQVAALFVVPRQLAERFVRSADFPRPVSAGAWDRAEVEAWGRANGRLTSL